MCPVVDVCKCVNKRLTCQRLKGKSKLQQQWKELSPVCKPFERIGIDIIEIAGGTHGFRYSVNVVDHHSSQVLPPQN